MMLVLRAEWTRFTCNRINLFILALVFLLLCASAAWSGIAAVQYRIEATAKLSRWTEKLQQTQQNLPFEGVGESAAAARTAFEFARRDAPPALRPALGGLALSIQQFTVLPADVRVSVDSRHLDGRKSDTFDNPLLQRIGMPDFAVVAALLLPLAIIGLCYGLVQEGREQGIWRVICAQTAQPWQVLFAGLLLRLASILTLAVLASLPAFILDSGATLSAFFWWSTLLVPFCAAWVAIAGLFNLLRISAAASALGMLAVWLFVTFASPSALVALAQAMDPAPSRLEAMIEIRVAQQKAEELEKELLDDWYKRYPEHQPRSISSHAWPVSVMPRYVEQDRVITPLMRAFDNTRARQVETVESMTWLAPGLALVLAADRLAGADAVQQVRYTREVDQFETRWQHYFMPLVMSYRGLRAADLEVLPLFQDKQINEGSSIALFLYGLTALTVALLGAVVCFRRQISHP